MPCPDTRWLPSIPARLAFDKVCRVARTRKNMTPIYGTFKHQTISNKAGLIRIGNLCDAIHSAPQHAFAASS